MATGFDVIVIGLGGMGSATVYQLAQRGQRVLGLEQFTPPHNRGSSHGKSRIIRQAYFEHPSYVPLLLRAYQLWQQIEQETNQKLLFLTGGLMIGPPKSTTVSGSRRSAQEHGLAYEILDAQQIHARFPLLHPDPSAMALFEAKAGFVRPEAAIRAHLQRAAQLGAALHFEEPVLDWHTTEQGVQVITTKTTYEADRLVIAPGAWAAQLLKLEIPFVVERQVLYWFEPLRHRDLFDYAHLPIYIWETEDSVQFYGFPAYADSTEGVKIAFFRAGKVCTPDTIDRTVYPHEVEMMRKYLNQYIPDLNGKLLDTVTCMYTNVPDEHFVIGLHPAYANVVVASPCSGHGFKFASVVGEILADLAINGHTPHPLELFSPDRFNPSFQ
ncbi:N-methyl-L-tryptophan oxidase [Leptolyngbya sp. NK1-12]|uniref:N-methyl-L-tryptophan oxidase n=1 Tax=Leptolyngbya sp. NK1-12 TaxID=2547451 RepID=A0AA96WNI7_9CYAN|nr:N-methyl-L-tryptophan oxidase [Leptolyngbya sp. NK1-12]WNZ25076.1 N-methyl-L-tryptophan oxidase [Leptolyngbya sp. NK1-12]